MIIFLLTFCFGLSAKTLKRKLSYVFLSLIFFLSMFVSFSRVSIFGTVLGFLALSMLGSLYKKIQILVVMCLIILSVITLLNQIPLPEAERLSQGFMLESLTFRQQEIWSPMWDFGYDRMFLGFGKGSLGLVSGLQSTEAHNHYLRLILESGIFGLLAFVWLLTKIIRVSLKVYKNGQNNVSKAVGGACLAASLGLGFCGLFQDAFLPVTLNEIWWGLIGLTAAAYKIENLGRQEAR